MLFTHCSSIYSDSNSLTRETSRAKMSDKPVQNNAQGAAPC